MYVVLTHYHLSCGNISLQFSTPEGNKLILAHYLSLNFLLSQRGSENVLLNSLFSKQHMDDLVLLVLNFIF